MDGQNKNLFLAMVLSAMVILTWSVLFPPTPVTLPADATSTPVAADATIAQDTATTTQAVITPEETAVADAPRIKIGRASCRERV